MTPPYNAQLKEMFHEAYTKGGLEAMHFKSAVLAMAVIVLDLESDDVA